MAFPIPIQPFRLNVRKNHPSERKQVCERVLNFSSQYGSDHSRSYVASNLAGEALNFPNYGDFTQSFVLRTYGPWWSKAPSAPKPFQKSSARLHCHDFVDLLFSEQVYPTKIEILETYNPGAVVRVLACSFDGHLYETEEDEQPASQQPPRWAVLWSSDTLQMCSPKSRTFLLNVTRIPFKTNLIRLEFNQSHLNYYTELDAVYLWSFTATSNECGSSCTGQSSHVDTAKTIKLLKQLSFTESKVEKTHEAGPNGYFDMLPSELINLIFAYMDLLDLARVARTCKLFLFHGYDPVLYKELNLRLYWTTIDDNALASLEPRCTNTERLDLSWTGAYGAISPEQFSRFLWATGKELVCLRLSACDILDERSLPTVVKHCPFLQELDLQSCTNIVSTTLLELRKLKHLRRLNLYRSLVTGEIVQVIAESCPNLEHLNLGGCRNIDRGINEVLEGLAENCRGLISLDLWRANCVSPEGIEALCSGCSQLQELDLGWCTSISSVSGCLVELTKKCPKLKKLFLTAIRSVCDVDINAVADNCPNLEQLDILGTALVYPESIQRVLLQCRNLQFLDVSFCSQLTKEYVKQWQEAFPQVSIKKSFITEEAEAENNQHAH